MKTIVNIISNKEISFFKKKKKKVLHGIQMLALEDDLLKNLIRDEDCLKSRPTNPKIMNAIC